MSNVPVSQGQELVRRKGRTTGGQGSVEMDGQEVDLPDVDEALDEIDEALEDVTSLLLRSRRSGCGCGW